VLIGIGIGIITAAVILGIFNFGSNKTPTRTQIENMARGYGMEYPSDFKVITGKEAGK
jgi:hypothetical protein